MEKITEIIGTEISFTSPDINYSGTELIGILERLNLEIHKELKKL